MALAGDNRCPVCKAAIWVSESNPIRRTTCPRCRADLWILAGSLLLVRRSDESEHAFLARLAAPLYGMSTEELEVRWRKADSLDMVEVAMDVEARIKEGGG